MKRVDLTSEISSRWLLAGLGLCLLASCSSPAPNKQVYDRYAELVAARNRAPVSSPANDSPTLDRRPLKTAPAPAPVSAPAAALAAPAASTTPVPAPTTVPASAPTPRPAPPVQVVLPKPAEAPALPPPGVAAPIPPAAPVSVPVPPATSLAVPAEPPGAVAPAAVSVPAPPSSGSPDGNAYTLKVGDGVQVYLRGIPVADAIEDVIDENGMISLPLINDILAAGMTASALEQSIRKTYLDQDIYRNITVNVVVPTRFYFIQGEIRAPGRFQIVSATRVSQAIAGAGGYTEYASGQVVIKRGGKILKTIKNSRRLERTPEDDILLEPDDIIEVRRSMW